MNPPIPSSVDVGRLGVVLIGRNEGDRLRRCLESVRSQSSTSMGRELPIVYVDSGSTDGSVELARSVGARVVDLDTTVKFTAARARNAGFFLLLREYPETEYVQFIDGDCELADGFLSAALLRLKSDESLAVVCGRRRERAPDASVFNRLCDLEWDTPIGETGSCGGDAMMRTSALLRAGGFRESLIAGEEPELCFRLRRLGYRVERLDVEMTLHDAALFKVSQWFQRTKRSGHAYAEQAALHGFDPERPGLRQTVSNFFWGVGVPAAVAGGALSFGPAFMLGGVAAYGYLFTKSYNYETKRPGGQRRPQDACLYAAACALGKTPEALGALTYLKNRMTGRGSKIIEYKGPSAGDEE